MSAVNQCLMELCLYAKEAAALQLSEALESLGALCVCVEDAQVSGATEEALFGEPGIAPSKEAWFQNKLQAIFTDRVSAEQALALLQQQGFWGDTQVLGLEPVPTNNWVRLTQSQFTPLAITPTFWVVPSWHTVPPPAQIAIALDPGLAFGTGAHPTTRMCLRWIAEHMRAGWRVLDYGCGSGILSIAAAKHGASAVDAVDVDTQAVQACRDNAYKNQCMLQVGSAEIAQGVYDLVLANILAMPLKVLAPLLCAHVKPAGNLILAGILEWQASQLQAAYAPYLRLQVLAQKEAWVLMGAQRSTGLSC